MKGFITFSITFFLVISSVMTAFAETTIRYSRWGDIREIKAEKEIVKAFNKEYKGQIKVDFQSVAWGAYWQRLQNQLAAGDAADVFLMAGAYFYDFANKGIFYDITEYMQDVDLSRYIYNKNVMVFRDRYYGMARDITLGGIMYYNKKIFDEAGIAYPDWTWDWDKWLDVAKKLTIDKNGNGEPDQWGTYIPTWGEGGLYPMIWCAGGEVLTEDKQETLINEPNARKALQFMYDSRFKHKVSPSEAYMQGLADPFMTGIFATTIGISSTIVSYNKLPFQWGVAPIPAGPGGRFMSGNQLVLSIYSKSKHPEEAWEFIKFATGPIGQRIMAEQKQAIPALKDVQNVYFDSPNVASVFEILNKEGDKLRSLYFTPGWMEWNNMLETTLGYVWTNKATLDKTLPLAKERVDAILERAWKK